MIVSLSSFLNILPEFIVAGVLAFLFYSEVERPMPKETGKLSFTIVHESGASFPGQQSVLGRMARFLSDKTTSGKLGAAGTSAYRSNSGSLFSVLSGIQILLLTVVIWILLSLSMIPEVYLQQILPVLPPLGILAYGALAVTLGIALASTISMRFVLTNSRKIALMAATAIGVFLIFYLPALQWLNFYSLFIRISVIYGSLVAAVGAVYLFSTRLHRISLMRFAVIGTYGSYVTVALLLGWNLIGNLFS